MGVLETVLRETISAYLPFIDEKCVQFDLLRGICEVSDLEYEPEMPPVYFLAGLPLDLTRVKVGILKVGVGRKGGLNFDVQADGAEVIFKERQWSRDIDEVVVAAQSSGKRRNLGEGERPTVKTWMDSLVPGLLDIVALRVRNVQVTVELCSGISFSFILEELCTLVPPKKFDLRLQREFKVDQLSIIARMEDGMDVAVVNPMGLRALFSYSKGLLAAELLVIDGISVDVDVGILEHVTAIVARARRWSHAVWFGRPPRKCLTDHPKRWWQYAIKSCSSFNEPLRETHILKVMRNCKKYKGLHIQRLRNNSQLSEADEQLIVELERTFDADMLLLLRMKAQKEVQTEEALQFAREGWLSRLLFGGDAASHRERAMRDVFKAFRILELSNDADRSMHSRVFAFSEKLVADWSRAVFKIVIPRIAVSILDKNTIAEVLTLALEASYHYDSALETSSLQVSLGDLDVRNEDMSLIARCKRTEVSGGTPNGDTSHSGLPPDGLLLFKRHVQPEARDISRTTSLFLSPMRVMIDFKKVLPIITLWHYIAPMWEALSTSRTDRPDQVRTKSGKTMCLSSSVNVGASYIQFVLPGSVHESKNEGGVGALLLTIADVALQTPMTSQTRCVRGMTPLVVLLDGKANFSLSRSLSSRRKDPSQKEVSPTLTSVHAEESVICESRLHVYVLKSNVIDIALNEVLVDVRDTDLRRLLEFLRRMHGMLESFAVREPPNDNTPREERQAKPYALPAECPKSSNFLVNMHVASLGMSFYRGLSAVNVANTTMKNLVLSNFSIPGSASGSAFFLEVGCVSFDELIHQSNLQLLPEPSLSGLLIRVGSTVMITVGLLNATIKPASISSLMSYYASIVAFDAVTCVKRNITTNGDLRSAREPESRYGRTCGISAASVVLEWKVLGTDLELKSTEFQADLDGSRIHCEMNVDYLKDRTRKGGLYSVIALPRCSGGDSSDVGPRLCIEYNPPSVLDIFMKNVRLSVFRHVIHDVHAVISSFADLIQSSPWNTRAGATERNGSPTDLVSSEQQLSDDSEGDDIEPTTVVRGQQLIIAMPGSVRQRSAAGIVCSLGKVVLRKTSMLIEFRESSIATTEDAVVAKDADWLIVLPKVDLDISHSEKAILHDAQDIDDSGFDVAGALSSRWTVSILNDVALLLTKEQIVAIRKSLFYNMLAQDFSRLELEEGQDITEEQNLAEENDGAKSARAVLEISTKDILLELLNEESSSSGLVAEALASFRIGPISFYRERSKHSRQSRITILDRSSIKCTSLSIYNTQHGTLEPHGLVVDAHSPRREDVALKLSSLMRTDPGFFPVTKIGIRVVQPWIVVALPLYWKIATFLREALEPCKILLPVDFFGRQTSSTSSGQVLSITVDNACIVVGSLRCLAQMYYKAEGHPPRRQCTIGLTVDARKGSRARREQMVSSCDLTVTHVASEMRTIHEGWSEKARITVKVEKLAITISPTTVFAVSEIAAILKNLWFKVVEAESSKVNDMHPGIRRPAIPKTVLMKLHNVKISAVSVEPMREVMRVALSGIESVVDLVERKLWKLQVKKICVEDLTAYRRALAKCEPTPAYFVTALNLGNEPYSKEVCDAKILDTESLRRSTVGEGSEALNMLASWDNYFSNITVCVSVAPVDLSFDSRSLPEIVHCFNEIFSAVYSSEWKEVEGGGKLLSRRQAVVLRTKSSRSSVRSIHITSFRMRLRAHAPSAIPVPHGTHAGGISSYIKGIIWRGMLWAFGRDEVRGFELNFPNIVLRDCDSNAVLWKLLEEYYRQAMEFSFVKQFLLQPRLSLQLGGVGLLTCERAPQLLLSRESVALLEDSEGLELKMLTKNKYEELRSSSDVDSYSETESVSSGTETLDLTRASLGMDKKLASLAGVDFFERPGEGFRLLGDLRLSALTGMKRDRYILYTVPEEEVGILVTDKRILKYDRTKQIALEAILLDAVTDCMVEDDVVVVHCRKPGEEGDFLTSRASVALFSLRGDFSTTDLAYQKSLAAWLGDCINKTRARAR